MFQRLSDNLCCCCVMQVSRLTGGQVYKYTYFQADLDGERFIADLRHNISRWVSCRIRIPPVTNVADPDPGSEFFPIPDLGSALKNLSILTQKIMVSELSEI
jgi:hypothetical protein